MPLKACFSDSVFYLKSHRVFGTADPKRREHASVVSYFVSERFLHGPLTSRSRIQPVLGNEWPGPLDASALRGLRPCPEQHKLRHSRWDLRSEVPIARGLAPTRAFPHRDLRTRPKPKRKVPVSQHRRSLRGEKSATAFGAARPSGTKPAASSDPRSRRRPVPRHPPPALPAARRIPRPGGPGRAPPPPPASPPRPPGPGRTHRRAGGSCRGRTGGRRPWRLPARASPQQRRCRRRRAMAPDAAALAGRGAGPPRNPSALPRPGGAGRGGAACGHRSDRLRAPGDIARAPVGSAQLFLKPPAFATAAFPFPERAHPASPRTFPAGLESWSWALWFKA